MKEIVLHKIILDEKSMLALGAALACACPANAIIFLHGGLGAGKTTLARGFIQRLGYEGKIKSPTYPLVEPYELTQGYLYHFDFYRIHHADELEFMGIQDYFGPQSICLIEWPEHAAGFLPEPDLVCFIEIKENYREIKIESKTAIGKIIVESMTHEK